MAEVEEVRTFYVSYHLKLRNGDNGFGSVSLDLVGDKVTRNTLKSWQQWIKNNAAQNIENVIILFFKELEGGE